MVWRLILPVLLLPYQQSPPERAAQDGSTVRPAAEETRLPTGVFRAGLQKRGLAELLELHLQEFPPADAVEAALMLRNVKLAEASDLARSRANQQALRAEANRLLEKLIDEHPKDLRSWDWRMTLARSLLYEEAEAPLTNVLYRGGAEADRRAVLAVSRRAVGTLRALADEISAEYARLDRLSVPDFEQLEVQGAVERLDRLAPQVEYLFLWALFYDAVPRGAEDPVFAANLREIEQRLEAHASAFDAPQINRASITLLVLSGMTQRRLQKHDQARDQLDRAISLASEMKDAGERQGVLWVITLGWIERIRNDADAGRFADALRRVGEFRAVVVPESSNPFAMRLVAALLERSVQRQQAGYADRQGRKEEAAKLRDAAWKPLLELLQSEPGRRADVYAVLYELLPPNAARDSLDPVEQCAVLSGLLADAGRTGDDPAKLEQAVEAGERFLASTSADSVALVPEALYQLGAAEYRRGRLGAAAKRFLEVARDHATFDRALSAAGYAAQLASDLHADPTWKTSPEVTALYREALELLALRYAASDESRAWVFAHGQLLEELGEYESAAERYTAVPGDHPQAVEAAFGRGRCLATLVRNLAAEGRATELRHNVDEFFSAQRRFLELSAVEKSRAAAPKRGSEIIQMRAEACITAAEIQVLPQVNRPAAALETLNGFEDTYPEANSLSARVWRVRLLAYDRTGRLDEAVRAVPTFVSADPERAGETLVAVYQTLRADLDRLNAGSDQAASQRRADMALAVARHMADWTARTESRRTPRERRESAFQLAEAHLLAGLHERAAELFTGLWREDGADASSADPRVSFGFAESLFQLGRYREALPVFNRLAVQLPPDDPRRWKALLRDLQSRTALGHPPQGILAVIQQQKQLHPALGGPGVAEEFERLERENQRRRDGGP